jgi:biopolymer transport protein ExbD
MNPLTDEYMGLKRRTKIEASFSMASMTDVIFLLLIFFMVSSTVVIPNAIKVTLPQSQKQTAAKPLTRVTIDANLNYYVAFGKQREIRVSFEDITPFLQESYEKEPEMYVALYADETVPYKEIVRILNIANENKFKMVLATRPRR